MAKTVTVKVNYKKIKKLLGEGIGIHRIARMEGVPYSAVQKIKKGERITEYNSRKLFKKPTGKNICTACGSAKKAPGNRFLCDHCYKTNRVTKKCF